jgi:hypothetical protein
MYAFVYVCMYTHVCMYVCMYANIHMCRMRKMNQKNLCVCTCVYVCVHANVLLSLFLD